MTLEEFAKMASRLIDGKYASRRLFAAAAEKGRDVEPSQAYISKVLSGKRPAPLKRISAWADALDLTGEERDRFIWLGHLTHAPDEVCRRVAEMEQEISLLKESLGMGRVVVSEEEHEENEAELGRALRGR